jgi:L-lactate dehydrogenase complex protein LldG
MSRDKILSAVKKNQPTEIVEINIPVFPIATGNLLNKYTEVLQGIGGKVFQVKDSDEIKRIIQEEFQDQKWILSLSKEVENQEHRAISTPHGYEPVDVLIMDAPLAVAENGAIWISDNEVSERVLPFITQHLVAVLRKENIVATMHEAYEIIGEKEYGFATFIAGPSKTADIEQSLVLGAHGPKTMTVFTL